MSKKEKFKKVSPDTTGKTNKVGIRGIVISICLITIITSIAFFPSLKNGFTNWDDNKYVNENILIKDLSWRNIKTTFVSRESLFSGNYHPLTLLSYSLEYHFFKLDPHAYHTTNFVLHILNSLFVFWFIYLISGKLSVSFMAGVFFGIHPMHVESVAWIAERKDVLSTFFFLLSLIGYIYYCSKKSFRFYYFALLMLVLSLLSKAMAITLPFVLLLCDYLLNRKFDKKILYEKIPFFVISIIFGIVAMFAQKEVGSIKESISLFSIFIASHGLIFYLAKMIFPVNLSCLYMYPAEIISELPFIFLFSPVLVIALGIMVFLSKKYSRKIVFSSLFFLVTILPVIQLIPAGEAIAADRYTYIPFIGLFYMLGEGFIWLYYRKIKYSGLLRNLLIVFLIGIIIVFSLLTRQRCLVWEDGVTLWTDFIKHNKDYAKAYRNRGNAYGRRKEHSKVISDYTRAIELEPDVADAYNGRGMGYVELGEYDRAISDFNEAIRLDSDFAGAYNNRGYIYLLKKEYNRVISDCSMAIRKDRNYFMAYYNRGNAYCFVEEYDKALSDYNEAIRIDPYFMEVYLNRAVVYTILGRYSRARVDIYRLQKANFPVDPMLIKELNKSPGMY